MRTVIHEEDEGGGYVGPQDLREAVGQQLVPGQTPRHTGAQGQGWVQVGSC